MIHFEIQVDDLDAAVAHAIAAGRGSPSTSRNPECG